MTAQNILASLDLVITALRRERFFFSACDCHVIADDLAEARDHYAKVVVRMRGMRAAKKKPTRQEIRQVMLEDIFRK